MLPLIAKCGLITFDTIMLYASATPPVPPAPKDQQVVPGFIETVQRNMQTYGGPVFIKLSYCAASLAETSLILAQTFPNHPYSTRIINGLTFPNLVGTSPTISVTPIFLVGSAMVAIGGLIRLWCFRTLGQHFTFEMSLLKNHKLVTSGPYGYVRHPSYTGASLLLVGALLSRGTAGSWVRESGVLSTVVGKVVTGLWVLLAVLSFPGFVSRTREEDRFLKNEFGQQWEQWQKRVPYKLIPFVY